MAEAEVQLEPRRSLRLTTARGYDIRGCGRSDMGGSGVVAARLFGALYTWAHGQGRPTAFEVEVPPGGVAARDLAKQAGLPLDLIEGVFVDGRVHGADHVIFPGQRVAFVPKGTPGPHRVFLGLYDAGKQGSWT
jgi:hypothetical protein